MREMVLGASIVATLLSSSVTWAADLAVKCEASKNKTAGAYYSCREKADATAISKATSADYSKCAAKFDDKWDGAETNGAGACPDAVLTAPMNAFLAAQATAAATVIAGGEFPPVCGDGLVSGSEQCDVGNLDGAACATEPGFIGGTLACGTGCSFDTSGCYATRFDASGPTILDHETGLEWEKKDGADGFPNLADPHDADNTYHWSSTGTVPDGGAFTDFLGKLNEGTAAVGPTTGCYAEHCDWRLPTIEELTALPEPTASEFLPGVLGYYVSASTLQGSPPNVWTLFTDGGTTWFLGKTLGLYVRAVRTAS